MNPTTPYAPLVAQRREFIRIFLARDYRPQHVPAAWPEHVGDFGVELDISVFEHLLDALRVLHYLPHQPLARARQVAQFLDRPRRNEARVSWHCSSFLVELY